MKWLLCPNILLVNLGYFSYRIIFHIYYVDDDKNDFASMVLSSTGFRTVE